MNILNIETVTVFNGWHDTVNDVMRWTATKIENIGMSINTGTLTNKDGMESAAVSKLYISFKKLPKTYMQPKKWNSLTAEEKETYITFNPGIDFFVQGDATDADLTQEDLYNYMCNNYDHVYKITGISEYSAVMPHFEIEGK